MTTYTKEEIKIAKRIAYNFAFGYENILLYRKFKFDKRTRIGNLANNILKTISVDKDAIKILKRKRAYLKQDAIFSNILSNKILLDYKKNKSVIHVYPDKLNNPYDRRNHFAKTAQDFTVLKVLIKYRATA